ncbi:VOC family protein [Oceanicella sp. SM1341]|uniref:VOC family protein n=1 Tax=Oceanicella sp. SM1341 TaxID=1548889 RepID=UPI000E47E152|nr:VOC family protein [Oceanicella sp. SM1341]
MSPIGAVGLPEGVQVGELHHVGIVFPDIRDAEEMMELLGLEETSRGRVEAWSVECIFTRAAPGGSPVEFIIPSGGPLANFNKGAGGLHHVAFTVPSLDLVRDTLQAQGKGLLESRHMRGAGPFLCNFLHPVHTRGVIVEFIELLPVLPETREPPK